MKKKSLKANLAALQKKQEELKRVKKHQEHKQQIGIKSKQSSSHVQKSRKNRIPFSIKDRILLVGEANFSFAAALSRVLLASQSSPQDQEVDSDCDIGEELFPGDTDQQLQIFATTLDSESISKEKYPDITANLEYLQSRRVTVLFDVDATRLPQSKQLNNFLFDKIVFNFPHVGLGIKDQDRNILENQTLILSFLQSCIPYLRPKTGEIHLTVKSGMPYDLWKVKRLARSVGLSCYKSFNFDPTLYPGYAHRRTIGYKEGLSHDDNKELLQKSPRTFIFRPQDDFDIAGNGSTGKLTKRKRSHDESSDDD